MSVFAITDQPAVNRLLKKVTLRRQLRDSGSVMYVCVHSFAFALASLHCNLFEQSEVCIAKNHVFHR